MKSLPIAIGLAVIAATCLTSHGQIDLTAPVDDTVKPFIPDVDRYNGRLFLERAGKLIKPPGSADYQIVIDDVMFRRGDMYMYCDSAHFYDLTNSLEAFGNVHMEQGDTLFAFGDRLVYGDTVIDGTTTQLAVLYSDTADKARLINRNDTLWSTELFYDMNIELGYYETGGELRDPNNRLVSVYGEYAPNTRDAIFRDDVILTSRSNADTFKIYSDYLQYNTDTRIAQLNAPSTIISKDGTILTRDGRYNTVTTFAELFDRSRVVTSTGRILDGDSIFYDHTRGYGEAFGDVILTDTINKSRLKGDYGFYNELTDSAFVTGHALAVDYSSPDSISLHGDTIKAFRIITKTLVPIPVDTTAVSVPDTVGIPTATEIMDDSTPVLDSSIISEEPETDQPEAVDVDTTVDHEGVIDNTTDNESTDETIEEILTEEGDVANSGLDILQPDIPTDSIPPLMESQPEATPAFKEIADTTHHIVAYPNVRFFRSDLQGVCDSMTYVQKDSLIHLNRDPIVWSGDRQIFGNSIVVHVNDSTADKATLPDYGFMAEMIEDGFYNQMSGKEMIAFIDNGQLRHLDVNGNVMIVFFPMNDADSTYTKVANAESSFLAADFNNQTIEQLKMWSQSTEKITPLYLAKKSIFFLPGFKWEAWRRPKGHDDLLTVPVNPNAPKESDLPATGSAPVDSPSVLPPSDNQNQVLNQPSTTDVTPSIN